MFTFLKKIALLLLVTAPVMAQNGFKTEKGQIVWEHVFPAGTDIKTIIEGQEKMKLAASEDKTFTGTAQGVKNNINTNSVRLKCDSNFSFTVTPTPQGYLVRVTNFVFLEKYGPSGLRIVPNSLEKYYLEYGKIRNRPKTQTDLAFVGGFLSDLFAGKVTAQEDTAITAK